MFNRDAEEWLQLKTRGKNMELETRELDIRVAPEEATRSFTAIAVPYDQGADIGGAYIERFVPGAIDSIENVQIFYGHDQRNVPIGKVVAGEDTQAGFEIRAELTPGIQMADEVYAAMRHGSLNKVSIGFIPVEQTRDGNTITRTKIDLREISIVPQPAFSNASIKEVREENLAETETEIKENMENENLELDVRQLADEVAEVRRLAESKVETAAPAAPAFMKFRSQGEYAKALATGDSEAAELIRTYTPGDSGDTYNLPGWVGFINNLINLNRPSWGVFSKGVLPASGLTVDYAKVTSNGTAVAAQAAEGDAIAQGNIVIGHTSANVTTWAGQTVLSKQVVERSSVPYLDTAFQAMSIAYANTTNAAVVSALGALDFTGKVMDMDGGTAKSVLEGITDGAKYIKLNSGLNAEFILAGTALYKYLVTLADQSGRPIVTINADGQNTIGNAPAPLQASIWGLPVVVDPTLGDTVGYLANSQALRLYESAGSPVRLIDEVSGQSNLQNSYAVYGYGAITVPFENAIVKLDFTA